jgi:probable rRNA maturation factor
MHIDFHDSTNEMPAEYVDLIQRILKYTAKEEGVATEAEMSVNFVDNEEIQELNRNYRQKNEPTDVISFALLDNVDEDVEIEGADIPIALGDIVISLDKAKEQAREYEHSLEREVCFLAVHGLLHLLGYNHTTEEDEKKMFQKQNDILGAFGIER